jgi:hypothetical protein
MYPTGSTRPNASVISHSFSSIECAEVPMQWSDAIKPPSTRTLRQFAVLWLVFFSGLAALRVYRGHADTWALGLLAVALVVSLIGLAAPPAIRPIYTGWMVAAFPIGWTVSKLVLALMFFVVLTPMAWVFRLMGRDALQLRRRARETHWTPVRPSGDASSYFRQS